MTSRGEDWGGGGIVKIKVRLLSGGSGVGDPAPLSRDSLE